MKNNINNLIVLYIVFIGCMAVALLFWITPYGSGVSSDSTVYMETAKNLRTGEGFSDLGKPVNHFPPFYPIFLTLASFLNNNLVQAARILNAILFGINVVLVALVVYWTAGRSFWATTSAIVFFLSSKEFLQVHSMAWSEPLFFSLSITCIILLALYIVRPALPLLISSSILLGLALLTRYVGVALLPAALIIVFFGENGMQFGRRIRDTLIFCMFACIPLGIFFIKNIVTMGAAANRSLVFHPLSISQYKDLIDTLFAFVLPIDTSGWVRIVIVGELLALLITGLIVIFKKWCSGDIKWDSMEIVVPTICFLFSTFYLLFLFVSIAFFDAYMTFDYRYLSPVFVFLIMGIFSITWTVSQTLKKPMVWFYFLVLIAHLTIIKMPSTIDYAVSIHNNGQGLSSKQWQSSESMAFVKLFAENRTIYTNGHDVLRFLANRDSLEFPVKIIPSTLELNQNYKSELDVMCKDISDGSALMVYFNAISWRSYYPTEEELVSSCQLPLLQNFADGNIYGEK